MSLGFLSTIASFLKVGLISFGGGAALIPMLEDELVQKNKWMAKTDFDRKVVIASIAPGSMPVAFLSMWNHKYSIISCFAYTLPGPLLFLILQTGFTLIGEAGVRYISFASVGIIAFIIMVVCAFIKRSYSHGREIMAPARYIAIILLAFILTSGNNTRRLATALLGLDPAHLTAPVFAVSMLQLLAILFFIIFFLGNSLSSAKIFLAAGIAFLYAVASGSGEMLGGFDVHLLLVMFGLAAGSTVYDVTIKGSKEQTCASKLDMTAIRNLAFFAGIGVGLTTLAYLISGESRTFEFAALLVLSSWQAFGGGEVYVSIAEQVFVHGGFVSEEVYFSQIVGVSSAMPGPVLTAITAGLGFHFGNSVGGYFLAWVFGLLSIWLAVVASALGALALFTGFGMFKDSRRLRLVVRYIIPVICGVLLNVVLTLLNRTSSVIIDQGVNPWIAVFIVLGIFIAQTYLRNKYQVHDMKLLLGGGIGTLVVFALIF